MLQMQRPPLSASTVLDAISRLTRLRECASRISHKILFDLSQLGRSGALTLLCGHQFVHSTWLISTPRSPPQRPMRQACRSKVCCPTRACARLDLSCLCCSACSPIGRFRLLPSHQVRPWRVDQTCQCSFILCANFQELDARRSWQAAT